MSFFKGRIAQQGYMSDLGSVTCSFSRCAIMDTSVRAHPVVESALLRPNGDTELCYVTTTVYEDQPHPFEMDPIRHFKKSRP